jgi:hypothetical protein
MIRRLVIVLAALAVVGVSLCVGTSSASFTSASTSTISASTTAGIQNLLHLYSQPSDPDGLSGYYLQPDGLTLAATGSDFGLAVDLGEYKNKELACNRVFTIKAASPLPAGISSIVVSTALTVDPGTGLQPIKALGFASVGSVSMSSPVTLSAGQKMQCNLTIKTPRPKQTAYLPRVIITVTYSGYSGTYFQYSLPIAVTST